MNNQLVAINQYPQIEQMSKAFVESGMFPDTKTLAQAVVKVMAGLELGLSPFNSMSNIYIIQGRACISAGAMSSKIKESGKYNYKVIELNETICNLEFFENNKSIGFSKFTLQDARKANTKNLDKFPRNMLFARAISNGMRWFCPDVFSTTVYTPEEMGNGEIIDNFIPVESKIIEVEVIEDIKTSETVINSDLDMIQEIKEAKSKLELRELTAKYKGQYNSNPEFKKAFDHRVYELNLDLLETLKNELDGAKNEVEVVKIMDKSEYKVLETSDLKDEYKELGDEAIKKCNSKKRETAIKQIREAQTLNALKSLKLLKNIEWYLMNDQEVKDLYKEMKESFEQESTLPKNDKDLMEEASKEATPTKVLVNK